MLLGAPPTGDRRARWQRRRARVARWWGVAMVGWVGALPRGGSRLQRRRCGHLRAGREG